ncbi:MAG: hypothetical protein U9R75_03955 [Candidatus Thermoplasmatota archaeon]|nr:hypothetical protein [Candidatus Thermoplasmatota archaeon]
MDSDDADINRVVKILSPVLGVVYLFLCAVNTLFIFIETPHLLGISIGSGEPILSFFLLLVALTHLRGNFLLRSGKVGGSGHSLIAWMSGLFMMVIVMVVMLASIAEGAISGDMYTDDILGMGSLTVTSGGILSMVFAGTYRRYLYISREKDDSKEGGKSC